MKRIFNILLAVTVTVLFSACGSQKENTEEVSTLSYREFYELMFEDYKNRIEWHEDDYNQEAKASIIISERGDCPDENCGKQVFVKNSSADQSVRVIIKTSFSIPNTLPYIANQFLMAPGDEVYLTCTSFCFGEDTYELDHAIVVAEYIADNQ
jgi:hypothetical protein